MSAEEVDWIEVRALEPIVILSKISDGSLFCLRMTKVDTAMQTVTRCPQLIPIHFPTSYECRGVDWIGVRALELKVILSKISDEPLFCLRNLRSIKRRRRFHCAQPTTIDSSTSYECRRVDWIGVRALEPIVILSKISDEPLFCLRNLRSIKRRRRFQCAQPTPIDSPTSCECRGVDWIEVRALEPKVILSKISDEPLFCLRKLRSIKRRRRFQCAQPTPIDSPTSYECRRVDWIGVRALEPIVIISKISDEPQFCLRKTKVDYSDEDGSSARNRHQSTPLHRTSAGESIGSGCAPLNR